MESLRIFERNCLRRILGKEVWIGSVPTTNADFYKLCDVQPIDEFLIGNGAKITSKIEASDNPMQQKTD